MIAKDMMLKLCQNLQKSVKLCTIRTIKYQIPACFYHLPHSYSSLFSVAKLNHCYKTSSFQHFPSANIWTCVKLSSSTSEEEESKDMVKITFVRRNGEEIELLGEVGKSVMDTAVQSDGVMQAACEGQLACTTCHVYVDPKITDLFPVPSLEEDDLLDNAPFGRPNSRLSCQLKLTAEMEGARFGVPAATTNINVDKNYGKSTSDDENNEDNCDKKHEKDS